MTHQKVRGNVIAKGDADMGIYVVGDIHGCYTQFTELRERIESKDPNATFILTGDILHRGREEEKMLAWAYKNITSDGKYQMVLGNHDDAFIEAFGDQKFETIFSLGREAGEHYSVSDEYDHFNCDKDLMHEYAAFLAGLPLIKKLDVNGQKFIIAHAWYNPELFEKTKSEKKDKFNQRFCLLWERYIENGDILDEYMPKDGEKLIHGHTPTICSKDEIHRGYSPGKVWDMGNSINIDCGLVFSVTNQRGAGVEYGNLAAYNLETGETEYLWDIPDGYASNNDEYYEDKQERLEKEQQERKRKRQEAVQRTLPYQLSLYEQIFNLDHIPLDKNSKYRVEFSFLNDYFGPGVKMNYKREDDYDFDNEPILALYSKREKDTLYIYYKEKWLGFDLIESFIHKVYMYKDRYYVLGVNRYNTECAVVTVYAFDSKKQILSYKTYTPWFDYSDVDNLLSGDSKIGKSNRRLWYKDDKEEPLGLVTCDFYCDNELLTVKILKNPCDAFYVRILDCQKNTITEISQTY